MRSFRWWRAPLADRFPTRVGNNDVSNIKQKRPYIIPVEYHVHCCCTADSDQTFCESHIVELIQSCACTTHTTQRRCLLLKKCTIPWRAYDAGVNGVADALHRQKGNPECKQIMALPTGDKLSWLLEKSLLPLQRHQREGTYYVKRKVRWETTDRRTGENVTCLRSRLEHVPGNLISLYRYGKMFPPDDVLEE